MFLFALAVRAVVVVACWCYRGIKTVGVAVKDETNNNDAENDIVVYNDALAFPELNNLKTNYLSSTLIT